MSHHLEKAKDEAQNSSSSHSKYKYKISTKHGSLFSTYQMLELIGCAILDSCISKFESAKAICLHVDELTNLCGAKILLLYLTTIAVEDKDSSEHYGAAIELDDQCDASSIASKINEWENCDFTIS
uniref:Uncharacterized protein n=1 Tax=Romanomermis culicivorax TaxID=13658 RepID=A0A915IDQ9_ROMCU